MHYLLRVSFFLKIKNKIIQIIIIGILSKLPKVKNQNMYQIWASGVLKNNSTITLKIPYQIKKKAEVCPKKVLFLLIK